MATRYPCAEQMAAALSNALIRLFDADRALIRDDANERSITHRLAIYLEQELPDWDVDCEYNRALGHGRWKKVLDFDFGKEGVRPDDLNARSVFPDIIVHRRGKRQNLLVMEVKKSTSSEGDERDLSKLKAFTDPRKLGYIIGVFLRVGKGKQATEIRFVKNGTLLEGKVRRSIRNPKKQGKSVILQNLEALDYGE